MVKKKDKALKKKSAKAIGRTLEMMVDNQGFTPEDIAERFHMHPRSIKRYYNGTSLMTVPFFLCVLDYIKVTPNRFFRMLNVTKG